MKTYCVKSKHTLRHKLGWYFVNLHILFCVQHTQFNNLHISAQMFDKTFGKLISSFFIACLKTNWHLLVKALFFTIGRCLRNARCCRKKQTAKADKSES